MWGSSRKIKAEKLRWVMSHTLHHTSVSFNIHILAEKKQVKKKCCFTFYQFSIQKCQHFKNRLTTFSNHIHSKITISAEFYIFVIAGPGL